MEMSFDSEAKFVKENIGKLQWSIGAVAVCIVTQIITIGVKLVRCVVLWHNKVSKLLNIFEFSFLDKKFR